MWLLSTDRAELRFFDGPTATNRDGGYAILSHTWGKKEQSYQDVRDIINRCNATGQNPRDCVSLKVKYCCMRARQDGYAWVWIDTCCINKESSAELSEAINSMFSYYSRAEMCYVYLEDVPANDDIKAKNSAFRKARWHTRGWTLQELIASPVVIFLSQDWTILGSKDQIAKLLEQISGVPTPYLIDPREIYSSAVAIRMSWAAHRKTTRKEDEAYCLLGIFGITMPIIYGEGEKAFQRLQMEILHGSCDTTIFTWAPGYRNHDNEQLGTIEDIRRVWRGGLGVDHGCFLLAREPRDFRGLQHHRFTPALSGKNAIQPYMNHQWAEPNRAAHREKPENEPFGGVGLPAFKMSPLGMECYLPVADVGEVTIAVLLADTKTEHMGLLLHPVDDNDLRDPRLQMYYVGWPLGKSGGGQTLCRVALLGDDLNSLRFRNQTFQAEWRNIVIRALPHPGVTLHPLILSRVDDVSADAPDTMKGVPFRIPAWLVDSLSELSFFPVVRMAEHPTEHGTTFQFNNTSIGESLFIQLGVCMQSASKPGAHWAQATIVHNKKPPNYHELGHHQCDGDHVDDWPDRRKVFQSEGRRLELAFVSFPHQPHATRFLYLDLQGTVYEELQKSRGVYVRFPPDFKTTGTPAPPSNLSIPRLLITAAHSQDLAPGSSATIPSHGHNSRLSVDAHRASTRGAALNARRQHVSARFALLLRQRAKNRRHPKHSFRQPRGNHNLTRHS